MNNQRYILLSLMVIAAVIGVTSSSIAGDVLARVDSGDPVFMGLAASAWVGVATTVVLFAGLLRTPRVYVFTDEVVTELRRVTWPTQEETVRSSTVVVVFTVILAAVLAVYDYVWVTITRAVLFSEL
jgi:preprotein translocase subunit SecE